MTPGGCQFISHNRQDCERSIGLGADTQRDAYGKPEGWCWSCWKDYKIRVLESVMLPGQLARARTLLAINRSAFVVIP